MHEDVEQKNESRVEAVDIPENRLLNRVGSSKRIRKRRSGGSFERRAHASQKWNEAKKKKKNLDYA